MRLLLPLLFILILLVACKPQEVPAPERPAEKTEISSDVSQVDTLDQDLDDSTVEGVEKGLDEFSL